MCLKIFPYRKDAIQFSTMAIFPYDNFPIRQQNHPHSPARGWLVAGPPHYYLSPWGAIPVRAHPNPPLLETKYGIQSYRKHIHWILSDDNYNIFKAKPSQSSGEMYPMTQIYPMTTTTKMTGGTP